MLATLKTFIKIAKNRAVHKVAKCFLKLSKLCWTACGSAEEEGNRNGAI